MTRFAFVLTLLIVSDSSGIAEAARIKQRGKVRPEQGMTDTFSLKSSESAKGPEEFWGEFLESREKPEMFRKIQEKSLGRTLKAMGIEGIKTLLTAVEEAHLNDEHFEDCKALVMKTLDFLQDAEDRDAEKAAKNQGASSIDKSKARMHAKTRWGKILRGEAKCPTGVTVQFEKAATLDEGLDRGQVRRYDMEDTLLAFDMDGTLIDMRDYYPNEMMRTFNEFEVADKVIITAADNRGEAERKKKKGGCEAVGVSLLAALKDGESKMPATNATACDDLVQGATWDMEAQLCQCPKNFFVNGINQVCRDKNAAWSEPLESAIDPQLVQAKGGKCYCEPDLFKTFDIDAVADCPDMEDSRGNFMIAKSGVIMDKYAKALGLNQYYRDPSLGRDRKVKQIVFFDDWVENPVNFADTMCFFEAPEGVEHIVGVWYATDRMEKREKEKIAKLKAGKLKGNLEGNYFNPDPVSDARLAGARQMFGVQ